MKFLIAFLFPVFAFAEITDVDITSFRAACDRRVCIMAELCGTVKSVDEKFVVAKVKVDNDAEYYAPVGDNGIFCVSVMTYTGRAKVSAKSIISGKETPPVVATLR